jgi:hypothetical protein
VADHQHIEEQRDGYTLSTDPARLDLDAIHDYLAHQSYCVVTHPDLQGLRRFALATRDAHSLYARFGFEPLSDPERHMVIKKSET